MAKIVFTWLLATLYLTACNNPQSQTSNDQKITDSVKTQVDENHTSDRNAIMKADSAWDKASEAKSVEGWLSYYTDDAIMMPPGEKICIDKASREASIKNMFAIPGASLRFQTTNVGISQMGDQAYAVGVYQWSSKDSKGNDNHETGKYCETWKKQPDGNWKCIVDIWNADQAK